MGTKRMGHKGGSASPKATDLTAKRGSHKIESEKTEPGAGVKAGRNMGGRDMFGERERPAKRDRVR